MDEVHAAGLEIGIGSMSLRMARVGGTLTIDSHPGCTQRTRKPQASMQ